MFGSIRNTAIAATVLVAGLGVSSATFAGKPDVNLTVQDSYTTTIVDKSVVSGTIRRCNFDGANFTAQEAGNMCSPGAG